MQLTYTSTGQSRERAQRKRLVEAMETAVEWYHQRLLEDPAARAGPRLPAVAGPGRRRRPPVQARLGARRLGRAVAPGSGIDGELLRATGLAFDNRRNRLQDALRARVLFPIFSDTGEAVAIGGRVLPGSDDPAKYKNSPETPIYAKSKTLYGLNWAKADIAASDQVVVCEGYTDVIGFHRAGVHAGRGHVRHGVHRGPRPAAQALRQPGRAGVRRRRRRPGRGRALLRVGAEVPGAGVGGPAARRPGPGRAGPAATPRRWPRPSADAAPFLGLPPRAGDGRQPGAHAGGPGPPGRAGDGGRQRAPRPQRPQALRRPGRQRGRAAGRRPGARRRAARAPPDAWPSPPVRRTAVRENAEFVAVAAAGPGLGVDRRLARRGAVRRRGPPPGVPRPRPPPTAT